mmetsp:Transcript_7346/g.14074  ORF Transcript_7346/g.14074 Transcript_7346/m.14074 type:complete len:552 (+) Transcript_7346:51-1706(+)
MISLVQRQSHVSLKVREAWQKDVAQLLLTPAERILLVDDKRTEERLPGKASFSFEDRPHLSFHVPRQVWPLLALVLICALVVTAVGGCMSMMYVDGAMQDTPTAEGHFNTKPADKALWGRRKLQVCQLAFLLVAMAQTLVVLPDSYDMARDLGQGALFSGWLVGISWPLQAVAIVLAIPMKSWSWASQRTVIICSMFVLCIASLVYAVASKPPGSWQASSQLVRAIGLIVGRIVIGPCIAFCVFLRVLAQQVTPPSESITFNIGISLSVTLGIGLGPMISPAIAWCIGDDDVHVRSAASSYMFALLWALFILFSLWCVPYDPSGLIADARTMRESLIIGRDSEAEMQPESLPESHRSRIWWGGLLYNAERTFIIAAVESATVFMMETEFKWDVRLAGYAVGCTFLTSIPAIIGVQFARQHRLLSDKSLVQSAVLIGACAVVLIFPMKVSASRAAAMILATDSVIFTMGFVSNGIIDGLAVRICTESSMYSIANYELMSQFMRNVVARSLAPPFSRYILSTHGRGFYAASQMMISIFGCWTAIRTVSFQRDT